MAVNAVAVVHLGVNMDVDQEVKITEIAAWIILVVSIFGLSWILYGFYILLL